jgi:uncharacterized caspase-like protein
LSKITSIAAKLVVLGIVLLSLSTLEAEAAKRVALVIGNDTYKTLPDLNNARADAKGMAKKLRSLGFEVILKLNASNRDMGRALADFQGRMSNAEVSLVFYAGHGIQSSGTNYLVPSDAQIEVEEDLAFEGVPSGAFLKSMKDAGSPLNIVIIDACRDNPLPKRSRSAARGLGISTIPQGIKGTAIFYSAAPGQTAADGPKGGNGVFTGELLKVLDEAGLKLEEVFKKTAIRVAARTGGKQDPWINSSVKGDFYFKVRPVKAPQATINTPPPTSATSGQTAEMVFWQSIQDSTRPSDYEAYLAQFPNGIFARLAHNRAIEYKTQTKSAVKSAPLELAPEFSVENMGALMVALKNSNVRAEPWTGGKKISELSSGTEVSVTGKTQVRGTTWYRIGMAGIGTGYVYGKLLKKKLLTSDIAAITNEGRVAYEKKDYAKAARLFQITADQGDVVAKVYLGVMYENGKGVGKDYSKAASLYRKAADQGAISAQTGLGRLYDFGLGVRKDYAKAVFWYSKAANQGDALAQVGLAYMYEQGRGVVRDYDKAVIWYRKAANQGDAWSQQWLKEKGL